MAGLDPMMAAAFIYVLFVGWNRLPTAAGARGER
jgi:hypothetical protein